MIDNMTPTKPNNPPAFPQLTDDSTGVHAIGGMSLRYWSAAIMGQGEDCYLTRNQQVLLAGKEPNQDTIEHLQWEILADTKFRFMRADAMLAEREKENAANNIKEDLK